MEGRLKFSLTQNWNHEYPELEPYGVIKYMGVDPVPIQMEGFSSCDEYGIAEWLPSDEMHFRPVNEETELAFIGDRVVKDGMTFLIIRQIREEKN